MPPHVDNPNPPMTYTFFTYMTPITSLSTDPTIACDPVLECPVPFELAIANIACKSDPLDIQTPFYGGPERTSHSKKCDASYIPRPPNAFILFRSSFIWSQQVPEKVEGNHSTLSKIIGEFTSRPSKNTSSRDGDVQVNTGRRFPARNMKYGKQKLWSHRQNTGKGTLTGNSVPEPMRSPNSK